MKINLKINGLEKTVEIGGGDMLYDILRKLGYKSVKKSCGTGSCGVCTVLLDGEPIPSCSYLAARADGHEITTMEGVIKESQEIARYINEEGAVQCGFCTPGFVLTVIAMKRQLENPTEEDINNYLVGNLCRCTGYQGQMRAVKKYMGVSE